jgi:hypothetical protein
MLLQGVMSELGGPGSRAAAAAADAQQPYSPTQQQPRLGLKALAREQRQLQQQVEQAQRLSPQQQQLQPGALSSSWQGPLTSFRAGRSLVTAAALQSPLRHSLPKVTLGRSPPPQPGSMQALLLTKELELEAPPLQKQQRQHQHQLAAAAPAGGGDATAHASGGGGSSRGLAAAAGAGGSDTQQAGAAASEEEAAAQIK